MDEKFFTAEQVANILQVHQFTILKFIREGKLKGIKLGRVYRIKESDVEEFLQQRMTRTQPKPPVGEHSDTAPAPQTQNSVSPLENHSKKAQEPHSNGKYHLESENNDENYYFIQ